MGPIQSERTRTRTRHQHSNDPNALLWLGLSSYNRHVLNPFLPALIGEAGLILSRLRAKTCQNDK